MERCFFPGQGLADSMPPDNIRICQMSSAHPSFDTRIFNKECRSLAAAGYKVTLIIQHDGVEVVDGIQIRPLPRQKDRAKRMTDVVWRAYKAALQENAELYHFHDPELIPVGILLALRGKRVIYDIHEDVPRDILDKEYIKPWLRVLVAKGAEFVEWFGAKCFDGVIAATPSIAARFPVPKTITVQNFPVMKELSPEPAMPYQERPLTVVFTGAIMGIRGIREIVSAMEYFPETLPVELCLAGKFIPPGLEDSTKQLPGWKRTRFLGWLSNTDVERVLGRARVGLALFHPVQNNLLSQPTKLFEYMSAGIPVVVSDFPLWRNIVGDIECGLLVDPLDPQAIATAIRWLLEHPLEAEDMGKRGQMAVRKLFNWEGEREKLLAFYAKVLTEESCREPA